LSYGELTQELEKERRNAQKGKDFENALKKSLTENEKLRNNI